MKDFFSKCGCNCGRCPAYKLIARTEEDRQRCSEGWAKYLGARLRPESIYCEGCQNPDPWKSGNVLPDRGCYVRPCAIETGVLNCAYCSAYPCEDLQVRAPGEDFRERIEARIGAPIPEEDYLAFIEPYEGLKHLAEIRASLAPEDIVPKAEVKPVRARIVDFPEDLPFSDEERTAFKALHGVLADILSARADTYVRQVLLKRRKRHILILLWVFGLYGELKEEDGAHLEIDSRTRGSKVDGFLVRKYDNTLGGYWAQSFRILQRFGVRGEFVRLEKGWLLKLFFDESAGGMAGLGALKRYATGLAEKHGEPVYAGNTRFKGEAFKLFSKADMWVLSE